MPVYCFRRTFPSGLIGVLLGIQATMFRPRTPVRQRTAQAGAIFIIFIISSLKTKTKKQKTEATAKVRPRKRPNGGGFCFLKGPFKLVYNTEVAHQLSSCCRCRLLTKIRTRHHEYTVQTCQSLTSLLVLAKQSPPPNPIKLSRAMHFGNTAHAVATPLTISR
jgi:hypothetical protein